MKEIIVYVLNFSVDENESMDYWDVVYEALVPIVEMEGNYAVEVDGMKFEADTSNISDDSTTVRCKDGYFLQAGYAVCVGCSPGTMFDVEAKYCVQCPVGMYQELTAKFECEPCPAGFTTNATGSWNRTDCYEAGSKVHLVSHGNESRQTIIGSVVGSILGIAVAIGIVVALWKLKRLKANTKAVSPSNVDLLTECEPTNGQSNMQEHPTTEC